MGVEHHGTHLVLTPDDGVAGLRPRPEPPAEPLPEFGRELRRVVRPNDSRKHPPARRQKPHYDRQVDVLAAQYWLEGASEQDARDRASARVEHLREKGEL